MRLKGGSHYKPKLSKLAVSRMPYFLLLYLYIEMIKLGRFNLYNKVF